MRVAQVGSVCRRFDTLELSFPTFSVYRYSLQMADMAVTLCARGQRQADLVRDVPSRTWQSDREPHL